MRTVLILLLILCTFAQTKGGRSNSYPSSSKETDLAKKSAIMVLLTVGLMSSQFPGTILRVTKSMIISLKYVCRSADDRFDHVVMTQTKNV
jgi:hypothetical protein